MFRGNGVDRLTCPIITGHGPLGSLTSSDIECDTAPERRPSPKSEHRSGSNLALTTAPVGSAALVLTLSPNQLPKPTMLYGSHKSGVQGVAHEYSPKHVNILLLYTMFKDVLADDFN